MARKSLGGVGAELCSFPTMFSKIRTLGLSRWAESIGGGDLKRKSPRDGEIGLWRRYRHPRVPGSISFQLQSENTRAGRCCLDSIESSHLIRSSMGKLRPREGKGLD